jgi:hypothetical protein
MRAGRLRHIWLVPALAFSLLSIPSAGSQHQPAAAQTTQTNNDDRSPSPRAPDDFENWQQRMERAGRSTSRISIMPARYLDLREALAGYRLTKVPLVAFDGTRYLAAGVGDDQGIYYFIPRLASLSGLSIARSIDLFFGAVLVISFLTGAAGLLIILDHWPLRLWAMFALCMLLWFSFRKGDVYIWQSASAVAVVPWFLYLLRKNAAGLGATAFLFGAGLLIGFANLIRSHAATGLAIFIALLVAFELKCAFRRKLALLGVLIAAISVPGICFHGLRAQRDAFLRIAQPEYSAPVEHHPFWDTVYIGFGFTKNPYVAGFFNEASAEKVRSISPRTTYLSPEYARIIRAEALRIIWEHPLFVLITILAKLRILLFLLLCWSNVGLLAFALYPKHWPIELAFWSAMAFNSLFGIIALPQIQYLLGFLAFAALYGIVSLSFALQQRQTGHAPRRWLWFAQKMRLA